MAKDIKNITKGEKVITPRKSKHAQEREKKKIYIYIGGGIPSSNCSINSIYIISWELKGFWRPKE